jgi:hypothetical protein
VPAETDVRENSLRRVGRARAAAHQHREADAGDRPADRERGPVGDQAEGNVAGERAEDERQQPKVVPEAEQAGADEADGDVHEREPGEPRVACARAGGHRERAVPDAGDDDRAERQQPGRRGRDPLRLDAQVVADGDRRAERSEADEDRELRGDGRAVHQVLDPLRRRDRERGEREPVPALPQQHAGGGRERDEQDEHGSAVAGDSREDRSRERAQDAERGDAARLPAQGQSRGNSADANGEDDRRELREQLIDLCRDRDRDEEARDPGRDRRESGIGARLRLVQPDAERQQPGRAGGRERDARRLADPAVRDREREQEDDADQHGEPAHPGEHSPADEVLEAVAAEVEPDHGGDGRPRRACRGRGRQRGSRAGLRGPSRCGTRRSRRRARRPPIRRVLEQGDPVVEVSHQSLQPIDAPLVTHAFPPVLLTVGR